MNSALHRHPSSHSSIFFIFVAFYLIIRANETLGIHPIDERNYGSCTFQVSAETKSRFFAPAQREQYHSEGGVTCPPPLRRRRRSRCSYNEESPREKSGTRRRETPARGKGKKCTEEVGLLPSAATKGAQPHRVYHIRYTEVGPRGKKARGGKESGKKVRSPGKFSGRRRRLGIYLLRTFSHLPPCFLVSAILRSLASLELFCPSSPPRRRRPEHIGR